MAACLDTRKEHQATRELWEVSLHGGGSLSWLSVPNTICLVGSLLGHTTIPYLRQSSFISLSWKKIWTQEISVLAAEWYCNLNSHPQASIPCPPEDTVTMQWHKRILATSPQSQRIEQLPVIKDASQGHLLGCGLVISHLKDSDDREEKKKEKNEQASFSSHGWISLGVSLFEAYPTQYYCNLRARHPWVKVKIPRQAEA